MNKGGNDWNWAAGMIGMGRKVRRQCWESDRFITVNEFSRYVDSVGSGYTIRDADMAADDWMEVV